MADSNRRQVSISAATDLFSVGISVMVASGQQQHACDRNGVLERDAYHLGGIDDARLELLYQHGL